VFNEPTEKEVNLMPIVVHGAEETNQNEQTRSAGFGTCGQIAICTKGTGKFTDSNNRLYTIKKGDIFFVAPESPHKYSPVKKPWIIKYIVFSGCELDSIFSSLDLPQSGVAKSDKNTDELIENIFSEYNSNKKSRHIAASAYLYKLLSLLSKYRNSDDKERNVSAQKLLPAIQYINEHFENKSLSSELIAASSGISHPHMCRLFKSAYNITPHEYIIQTRLEYAKYLLCNEKTMTVQTISDKCGFNSSGYFIKVFKSKTGITPIEFRVQNTYNF